MNPLSIALSATLIGGLAAGAWLVRHRNMHYWLGDYVRSGVARRRRARSRPRRVFVCIADHHEPLGGTTDLELALLRTRKWCDGYERASAGHADSEGRPPQHTYFYPAEEYAPEVVDRLAGLCRKGLGELEVHLHHDDDNAENLRRTLDRFTGILHGRHGALRRDDESGQLLYCFVHGNWALDNSRPDGRWCGVDDELSVLSETGCRVDMTMPSAPSDTQVRKINSIYFAKGRAGCRKSHDQGRDVQVGDWARDGEILMIQGPLGLNWREAKWRILPRIETGEISFDARPTRERVRLWSVLAPSVIGAPDDIFLKLHMHGATDKSLAMLFDEGGFDQLWTLLEEEFRDRPGTTLHYVTAWEMAEHIHRLARARGPASSDETA